MTPMTVTDVAASALGGALVGVSATLLMLFNGRIAGISGILADTLVPASGDKGWKIAFLAGLIAAPLFAGVTGFVLPMPAVTENWATILVGGALVGFGARLGSGCTAGHGMCGLARLSTRSLAATAVFMSAAIVVVGVARHLMGG